jgi:Ca2+-binding RTX toxin-like protein
VAGNLAGLGLWGVQVTGEDLHLHLSGSVEGYNGVQVVGGSADIVNLGRIEGQALGLGITYAGIGTPPPSLVQMLNEGTILGSVGAISVVNDRLDLVNSGTLHSLGSSAISTFNGARIVNTGTISVGPNGSAAFSSLGNETDVIRNFGTMLGDAVVAAGDDVVRNRGTIDGNIDLGTGNDRYDGRSGAQSGQVLGGNGADTLLGGAGDDMLSGGNSNDLLNGGGGNDRLSGGSARDVLTGGSGEDVFVFLTAREAGNGAQRDVITDMNANDDVIDLSAFMAGGSFIGTAAFTAGGAANRVRYDTATRLIEGDLNGDGVADFQIDVTGLRGTLTAANFDFVV